MIRLENCLRLFTINYSLLQQNNESLYMDILKKYYKKLKDFVEFKRKIRGRK